MLGGPDVLWGGVVPALVAATTLTLMWRLTKRSASAWRTAMVVGYLVGHWTLGARDLGATALLSSGNMETVGTGWAYNPANFDFGGAIRKTAQPREAQDWLPLLSLLAITPDAIACVGKFGPAIGWVLRVILCFFLPWRVLHGSSYLPLSLGPEFEEFDLGGWSTGEAVAWIIGTGITLIIAWQWIRLVAAEGSAADRSLRLVLASAVTVGSAVTLIAAGSLLFGQLMAVLTAATLGCGIGSAISSAQRGPDAAAGPLTIAFGTLVIAGHFYAELSLINAGLLLLAIVLAVGWLPTPAVASTNRQILVRGVICLAVLTIPVVPSLRELAGRAPATHTEAPPNPYETFQP